MNADGGVSCQTTIVDACKYVFGMMKDSLNHALQRPSWSDTERVLDFLDGVKTVVASTCSKL